MNTKRLSVLIDVFYTAALEPDRWPSAAAEMARFFDSESTAIQVRGGDFSNIALRATTPNYDQVAQQDYLAHFHKLDPFVNGWRAIGEPGVFVGPELVDSEVLRRLEVYQDYLRRLGVFRFLGAACDLGGGTTLMLGIHRSIERDEYTVEHRRSLQLVLPHLSRAVQMHTRLASASLQRRLAGEMLETLSVAAIVVSAEYRILFTNSVADQLLTAGDGLRVQQWRLTTRDPRQDIALQRAICSAVTVAGGGVVPPSNVLLVRRPHKRPLSVLVAPLQRDAWAGGPTDASAIVFVSDPESRRPPASAALAALYQLTPAEARLLEALLRGDRLAEYADRAGISINTANTQLKQIFAKTGTNRQSDLMRQVFSDPIASLVCLPLQDR